MAFLESETPEIPKRENNHLLISPPLFIIASNLTTNPLGPNHTPLNGCECSSFRFASSNWWGRRGQAKKIYNWDSTKYSPTTPSISNALSRFNQKMWTPAIFSPWNSLSISPLLASSFNQLLEWPWRTMDSHSNSMDNNSEDLKKGQVTNGMAHFQGRMHLICQASYIFNKPGWKSSIIKVLGSVGVLYMHFKNFEME